MSLLEFTVHGEPRPAGSKNAFQHPKTGKIVVTDSSGSKGKTWRQDVAGAALDVIAELEGTGRWPLKLLCPLDLALEADFTFYRTRPKSHFGTGRNSAVLKESAPAYPTTAPDVDKLSRAVLDALKGIVWKDDSRVVTKTARKRYAERDYAVIRVDLAPVQTALELPLEERLRWTPPDAHPPEQFEIPA